MIYKNYKNRLRLAKVIVKNKMSCVYLSLSQRHKSCIVNMQIRVRDFKYVGKICPVRIGQVIRCMCSACKRTVNGIWWEMSELITQERIAVGSSNLVEVLTMWPAMYGHWPRSKGQRSRSRWRNVSAAITL